MPPTRVVIYCDEDGEAPFIAWLLGLPELAQDKVRLRAARLAELGHEMRRPEADYLRDGIYELRAAVRGVQYRVLCFFHGREAVILTNGLTKEQRVPDREIELALRRKGLFEDHPGKHTLKGF
jgi:phage-related protein